MPGPSKLRLLTLAMGAHIVGAALETQERALAGIVKELNEALPTADPAIKSDLSSFTLAASRQRHALWRCNELRAAAIAIAAKHCDVQLDGMFPVSQEEIRHATAG